MLPSPLHTMNSKTGCYYENHLESSLFQSKSRHFIQYCTSQTQWSVDRGLETETETFSTHKSIQILYLHKYMFQKPRKDNYNDSPFKRLIYEQEQDTIEATEVLSVYREEQPTIQRTEDCEPIEITETDALMKEVPIPQKKRSQKVLKKQKYSRHLPVMKLQARKNRL